MADNGSASAMHRAWARLVRAVPAIRTFGPPDLPGWRPYHRGSTSPGRRKASVGWPSGARKSSRRDAGEQTLTSRLARIGWTGTADSPQLRIEGSAWRRGGEQAGSQITAVTLDIAGRSLSFAMRPSSSPAFNDHSRMPSVDRTDAGFVATLSAETLRAVIPGDEVFEVRGRVRIAVSDRDGQLTGGFSQRDETGSPGQPHAREIGAGCLARPGWDGDEGLVLTIARRAVVAERLRFSGTTLQADMIVRDGFQPVAAELRRGDRQRPLLLQRSGATLTAVGDLADLVPGSADTAAQHWSVHLVDGSGGSRHLHWQGPIDHSPYSPSPADPRLGVRYAPSGVVRVDVYPARLAADEIGIEPDGPNRGRLTIAGECHGLPSDPSRWALAGGRLRLQPSALVVGGGRFTASFDLLATPEWGQRPMPLPSAAYTLTVACPVAADLLHEVRAEIQPSLAQELPLPLATSGNRIRVERTPNSRLRVTISAPLDDGATSPYNRQRLEIMHRTRPVRLTDAVLFNSFNGRAANDNTRAVHDELVRRQSNLSPLWTVADLSVEVPDGAQPVIFWSAEWWQALTCSRYVVTNCWMPTRFRRRDGQRVLQTWHGTPLKLLGFDRIGTKRGAGYRAKTQREVQQWSYLIAQNPFSRNVFRSAYDYQGEVLEIGYPRNDMLSTPDPEYIRRVRKRLGIADHELVVLYTPTWREGAGKIFTGLDLEALQKGLGGSARVLVRGHVNTVGHGGPLHGPSLIDVTMYPLLSDLYLISDVMITDYSSTMFDFSVTGKPMVFFVPDLDEYAGRKRGTYFDLAAEAPGPLLRTTEEVVSALQGIDRLPARFAGRYAAWRRKFNPYDDGHSAERAVDALLADP